MNATHDTDYDLQITKCSRQEAGFGTWISGTVNDTYRFDALVFPEHAENSEYEIGDSQISKLWIARGPKRKTVYNWDRGLDVDAATPEVRGVVEILCAGLAETVFGE
jgi:hypothetical protein